MSKMNRCKLYNRRILVDTFQLRFVGVAIFHFVLVVAIFLGALYAPIIIDLRSDDISSPHVQAAAREFLIFHARLWLPLLGAFILLILHNILVSHRVAGPLYRFRRYLTNVGEGDLSAPIRFRKGDYLGKEAQAANTMVESLRTKVVRMQEQLDLADTVLADLKHSLAGEESGRLEQKINEMDEHLESCRAGLRAFTTNKERIPSKSKHTDPVIPPVELEV